MPANALTRRALFKRGGVALLGSSLLRLTGAELLAQLADDEEIAAVKGAPAGSSAFTPLNRFPRSVQEDYVRRVREVERATQATLKQALTSFSDVAETEEYHWPLSALVPGILKTFDLPDCYRELAGNKLRQIEPVSAEGIPA